ncbi:MAG TPA: hypothetical protein EYP22_02705 [Methanosarcinales archaeon]|nr:hypothetical protein [Methanosarcinales archaeon]
MRYFGEEPSINIFYSSSEVEVEEEEESEKEKKEEKDYQEGKKKEMVAIMEKLKGRKKIDKATNLVNKLKGKKKIDKKILPYEIYATSGE